MEVKLKDKTNKTKIGFFSLKIGTVFLYKKIEGGAGINVGMKVRNLLSNEPMMLNIKTGNLISPFTSFPLEPCEIISIIDCELVEK